MTQWNVIESTKDEIDWIESQIDDFNRTQTAFTGKSELFINYSIKDKNQVVAGITTCMYFEEVLYVGVLYVSEQYRHHGLGSILLEKAETKAKDLGGKLAHLHTFDFQAKDFYLNHGYEVFGELENCPTGYKHYFMKKVLTHHHE